MITTSQKPGHQYLRKLLVLPVAAIIVALFAFSYKKMKAENDLVLKTNEPITIVVDAGHGGADNGARSLDGKTTEAVLTLEISKLIQQLAPEYNINVVMTREDENFPDGSVDVKESLRKRVEISNSVNASAFISVHVNAAGAPGKPTTRSGFELYISKRKGVENDKRLATGVLDEVSKIYKTDKVIKQREQQGIFVLDNTVAAAINLECGYITNPKDLEFITNKANQEKIARAILNGVSKFANTKEKNALNIETDKPITDTPKIKQLEVTLVDTAPLLVLDGKIYGRINIKGRIKKIDAEFTPDEIESVTVLKSPGSVNKYGEQGKYGVIEIFTKKFIAAHPEIVVERKASYEKYNKDNNPPLPEVVVMGYRKKESYEEVSDNDIPIFEKVEIPPSFTGGKDAWRKFLEKNLDASIPTKNGAKAGTYTVMIQFIVDKSGDIRSLKALTNHGFGMEEEVVRVIAKGPKWNPASQNGKIVNAFHTQPVTFVITEDVDKETPIITKNQD